MIIDRRDWPRCAKCDLPVEDFTVEVLEEGFQFVAQCHRQTETSTLSFDMFRDLVSVTDIDIGKAFATQENNKMSEEKKDDVTYLAGSSGPTDTVAERAQEEAEVQDPVNIEAPEDNDPENEDVNTAESDEETRKDEGVDALFDE